MIDGAGQGMKMAVGIAALLIVFLGLEALVDLVLARIIHDSRHKKATEVPTYAIGAVSRRFYAQPWRTYDGDRLYIASDVRIP